MSLLNVSHKGNNLTVVLSDKTVEVPVSLIKGYFSKVEKSLNFALRDTQFKDVFTPFSSNEKVIEKFTKEEAVSIVQTVATTLAQNPQLKAIDWKQLIDLLPANVKDQINKFVDNLENGVEKAKVGIDWTFIIVLLILVIIASVIFYKNRKL